MSHSFERQKIIIITNVLQKFLDESSCKSNKTWADKSSELYNRSTKSLLQDNDIKMYSIHNEGNLLFLKDLIRSHYTHIIFAIIRIIGKL